jgi:hypothetical protein
VAVPRYNDKIVAQGLARLTSAFITKANVRAMLAVYLKPFQDLEDATWGVLTGRFLATATVYVLPQTNTVFDSLGTLVGQPRAGMSDGNYKPLIYLRVAVNRATGRITDWATFATILLQTSGGPVNLYEGEAAVCFGVWDMTLSPPKVAFALSGAVPNGVYGLFKYTTWPDGNDFMWGSRYDATAGQGKWGSRYDAAIGGLFVAASPM